MKLLAPFNMEVQTGSVRWFSPCTSSSLCSRRTDCSCSGCCPSAGWSVASDFECRPTDWRLVRSNFGLSPSWTPSTRRWLPARLSLADPRWLTRSWSARSRETRSASGSSAVSAASPRSWWVSLANSSRPPLSLAETAAPARRRSLARWPVCSARL